MAGEKTETRAGPATILAQYAVNTLRHYPLLYRTARSIYHITAKPTRIQDAEQRTDV